MWTELLRINKVNLDLSSIQLDGSHTPVKRGGEAIRYQYRKKIKNNKRLIFNR